MPRSWFRIDEYGDQSHPWSGDFRRTEVDRELRPQLPDDPDGRPIAGVGPVTRWDPYTLVAVKKGRPVRNWMIASNHAMILSDHAKRAVERVVADEVQFLPVLVHHAGTILDIGPYWVVNPLRMVDCVHRAASKLALSPQIAGQKVDPPLPCLSRHIVLVPELIPEGAHMFVPRFGYASLLIFSDEVHRELKSVLGDEAGFQRIRLKGGQDDSCRDQFGSLMPAAPLLPAPVFDPAKLSGPRYTKLVKRLTEEQERRALAAAALATHLGKSLAREAEIETGEPASEAAIRRLEKLTGCPLPRAYADFLRSCGTAVIGGEDVYGVSTETANDAHASTTALIKDRSWSWPRHMLVIGADGRGGDYCLDLSRSNGEDCPVVYHDHELDEIDEAGIVIPHFEKLSPSFGKYVRKLARGEPLV